MSTPHEVTEFLTEWTDGDPHALDRLMPLEYGGLRQLADSCLRREEPGHSLEPAELVHEAYLRLVDRNPGCENRPHFYGVVARLMRQVLIDHARRRKARKRAGAKVPLDEAVSWRQERPADLIALDDALKALERMDARKCRAVELCYFEGLSMEEIAQVLNVSLITVRRDLRMAEAWLRNELGAGAGASETENKADPQ